MKIMMWIMSIMCGDFVIVIYGALSKKFKNMKTCVTKGSLARVSRTAAEINESKIRTPNIAIYHENGNTP